MVGKLSMHVTCVFIEAGALAWCFLSGPCRADAVLGAGGVLLWPFLGSLAEEHLTGCLFFYGHLAD